MMFSERNKKGEGITRKRNVIWNNNNKKRTTKWKKVKKRGRAYKNDAPPAPQGGRKILTSMTRNCHLIVCSTNPAFTTFLSSSCCFQLMLHVQTEKLKENNTTGCWWWQQHQTTHPVGATQSTKRTASQEKKEEKKKSFSLGSRLPAVDASQPLKWLCELVETGGCYYLVLVLLILFLYKEF